MSGNITNITLNEVPNNSFATNTRKERERMIEDTYKIRILVQDEFQ